MAIEPDEPEGNQKMLKRREHRDVNERRGSTPRIVHEVIRREGREELSRATLSLLLSGFVAGVAINASVLGRTYFRAYLPDAPWRHLVEALGYTFGFMIVILGRLQLFTESTVTPVLPFAVAPTRRNLALLGRLWILVLGANLAGTFFGAAVFARTELLSPIEMTALLSISHDLLLNDAWRTFLLGVPAGFLMAAIAWTLPSVRQNSFWIVLAFTYLIALGGYSHVVAGATEAWTLAFAGTIRWGEAWWHLVLPSLAGNLVGGTLLFAALAHGQVASELVE